MRPDTRSFSFTWTKGQQRSGSNLRRQRDVTNDPNGSNTEQASSGVLQTVPEGKENPGRSGSTSRLKRIGTSFVRGLGSIAKYSSFEADQQQDQEQQPKQKRAEPLKDKDANTSSSSANGVSIGKRLNKTVQDVRTSLGNFSQKFRRSTRRRYRMGPGTPGTEISPTRRILGRTPTKLYSPFGFDSPLGRTPIRNRSNPVTSKFLKKGMSPGLTYSPSNNFNRDVAAARQGLAELQILSRDITRRSVRF